MNNTRVILYDYSAQNPEYNEINDNIHIISSKPHLAALEIIEALLNNLISS